MSFIRAFIYSYNTAVDNMQRFTHFKVKQNKTEVESVSVIKAVWSL